MSPTARDASPNMRVLHLIDPASAGWPGLHALSCLLRAEGAHTSRAPLLIGSSADERLAADLGVCTLDRIPAPAGRIGLAAAPFRRFLSARGEPDVIHAWSRSTLALAAHVRPATPAIATFAQPMPHAERANDPLRFLFTRDATRRRSAKSPPSATTPANTLFVPGPLPIDAQLLDPTRRARLRAAWGVDETTTVVGLVGEPASVTDAWGFGFVVGFLHVAGRRVAGVAHPDSLNIERALRFIQNLVRPWTFVLDSAPPWRLIPGLDAAIWLGSPDMAGGPHEDSMWRRPSPGAESLAWAVAAGLPVVIEDRPTARDALEQRDAAGLIPTRRPLDLAHALMRLVDNRDLGGEERRVRAVRTLSLRRPADWVSRVEAAYLGATNSRRGEFGAPIAAVAGRSAAPALETTAARS